MSFLGEAVGEVIQGLAEFLMGELAPRWAQIAFLAVVGGGLVGLMLWLWLK